MLVEPCLGSPLAQTLQKLCQLLRSISLPAIVGDNQLQEAELAVPLRLQLLALVSICHVLQEARHQPSEQVFVRLPLMHLAGPKDHTSTWPHLSVTVVLEILSTFRQLSVNFP